MGDVNGDGKLDVVASGTNAVVLLGLGNGNLSAPSLYPVGGDSLALGDLDRDGHPDIVVSNSGTYSVSVLTSASVGTFSIGSTPSVGTQPYTAKVGDLNSDGQPDVANYGSNSVSVLLGSGNGHFA